MTTTTPSHRLAIAPMMEWTDRHDRYLLRLLSRRCRLYTEMLTTGALLHGDRDRFLAYDPLEHPVALQLGGSDPSAMSVCAGMAEDLGYDEVNINVGCPSDRVQSGRFGACLMKEPDVIARCVEAMRQRVAIPVTVKCRIGVDDHDRYADLFEFVRVVSEAGCTTFAVHARKAWLKGLSPKQNREVPPLRYDVVRTLKNDFPGLTIIVNGGITSFDDAQQHLQWADGVMIGREAYTNPYLLATADQCLFGDARAVPSRQAIVAAYLPYAERELGKGVPLNRMTRHLLGLFQGQPGAKAWRRHLSERAHLPNAGLNVLRDACDHVGGLDLAA